METQIKTAHVFADQEAPENKELLIEQVLDSIMKLADEEKICVLLKYAEKYGLEL